MWRNVDLLCCSCSRCSVAAALLLLCWCWCAVAVLPQLPLLLLLLLLLRCCSAAALLLLLCSAVAGAALLLLHGCTVCLRRHVRRHGCRFSSLRETDRAPPRLCAWPPRVTCRQEVPTNCSHLGPGVSSDRGIVVHQSASSGNWVIIGFSLDPLD